MSLSGRVGPRSQRSSSQPATKTLRPIGVDSLLGVPGKPDCRGSNFEGPRGLLMIRRESHKTLKTRRPHKEKMSPR